MEQKITLETLKDIYDEIWCECSRQSDKLLQKRNIADGVVMKELADRMTLLKYKTETVKIFIDILKEAECRDISLGEKLNADISFYYTDLLLALKCDTDYGGHYFADKTCLDLLDRWEKLCGHYKTYFMKIIYLPKTLDTDMYKFAEEIAEDIEY